jgi:VanZ family protein
MTKPPRPFLHAARLADAALFWPVLAFVVWGELAPDVPDEFDFINDKLLHFGAYFVLGAMAGGAVKKRGRVKWVVLALILVGGAMEVLQAAVGRDASVYDELANGAGAISGALLARFVLDPLRARWGYDVDSPSR